MKLYRTSVLLFTVIFISLFMAFTASAAEALAVPQVAASGNPSNGKPKLSWTAVEGADQYQIYRATSKNGTYKKVYTATGTGYINTSATVGTRYYYKVRAVDTDTNTYSAFSAVVSRTCDLAKPTVTVSNIASTGKIKISWNAVDGAAKYVLYHSTTGKTGSWTAVNTTKTSITHSSAKAGTKYYYKVRAIHTNTDANSAYSAAKTRVCDVARPAPAVTLNSSGKPVVSWKAVSGASKYILYHSTTGKTGSWTAVNTTKISVTHSSAKAGTKYYYKVRAIHTNTSANSAYSPAVTATCKLAAPQISVSLNSSGKPVVSWKAVSGAVKYQVYRATGSGSYSLLTTTTNTKITNTSLAANKNYYYKVMAVAADTAANSAYSNIVSVTTGTTANDVFVDRYIYSTYAVLYQKPDVNSNAILLKYREKVGMGADFAIYDHGRWTTVLYNGKVYYNWIEPGVERFTSQAPYSYVNSANTKVQNAVLELALEYTELPTSYLHDESEGVLNSSGTYGFDCSGFAGYVLNTALAQYNPLYTVTKNITGLYETQTVYNNGFNNQFDVQDIALKNIRPGDIIFFDVYEDSRDVDHCGIYLGNNEFVHATSFHDRVVISPLKDEFADNFRGVRRYFPATFKPASQQLATNYKYVYLYAERSDAAERMYSFELGEQVTLLYTSSNGNWGYVRNKNGLEGYVLMKRFDIA